MEILVVTVAATSVGLWDEGSGKGQERVRDGSQKGHERSWADQGRLGQEMVKDIVPNLPCSISRSGNSAYSSELEADFIFAQDFDQMETLRARVGPFVHVCI